MKISRAKSNITASTYNQTNIHVNALWRFKRHFGIGATASLPLRQGGKFDIQAEDHNTLNENTFQQLGIPLDYFFDESAKVSVNGRIYGGIKGNFYLDGRISMFSFRENLTLNTSQELEKNTFKQVAPGFSIGMQPHLNRNLFMNLNMSFDFYQFKDTGFKNGSGVNSDAYGVSMYSDIVYFKSQMPEKKMAFSANIGFGYFF